MCKIENIYHCCIQKTASQWIKSILSDKLVYENSKMNVVIPEKNFIGTRIFDEDLVFEKNKIISPLYINYDDFIKVVKPKNYKAIFIMRDPRDFVISYYFSIKYSHSENPYILKIRNEIEKLSESEGIEYFIKKFNAEQKYIIKALLSWNENEKSNNHIKVYKYENLIGNEKLTYFNNLLDFVNIKLEIKKVEELLDKYSFKTLTQGRTRGNEDIKSHYRKGIAGDWKNYFTLRQKNLFKEIIGNTLVDLNYEKNNEW